LLKASGCTRLIHAPDVIHPVTDLDRVVKKATAEWNIPASDNSVKENIKATEKITEVRKDAAGDKRDAEYAVAIEKCDALAGDAKSTCVGSAKSRYGKS